MDSYGLPRRFIRGLIVFGMVAATYAAGGLACAATDEPSTWEEALRQDRAQNIKAYGENILMVSPGAERLKFGRPTSAVLTIQDVQALAKRCPSVIAVAPIVQVRGEVAFQSRNWIPMYFFGTTQSYLAVRDWTKLKEGRPFSDEDVRDAKAVCLLGQSVADALFPGTSPLGHQITIKGKSFRVLGVLSAKGRNSLSLDQDDVILTPWTAAGRLFDAAPQGKLHSIWAKAASGEKMPAAIREMTAVLRTEHHIPQGGPNDFTILDLIKSREELMVQVHEAEHGLVPGSAAQAPQPPKSPDQSQGKLPAVLTAGPLKADPKDGELRRLLKARYNEALGELKDFYEAEEFAKKHAVTRRSTPDDWYGTWYRLVHAGLEAHDKPADQVGLLTQYLEVTKELEKIEQERYNHGRIRLGDLHRARYERLDAEIRLLRAKREAEKGKDKR